jgi:hypothetical protein
MTDIYRRNGACVAAMRPAYGDVVVITTVSGKVAALDPVREYDAAIDRALTRALTLAGDWRPPVKVLPMTMAEALAFCRVPLADLMADMTDEEWRHHCIKVCTPMLSDPDPRVRADATEVLTSHGAMPDGH